MLQCGAMKVFVTFGRIVISLTYLLQTIGKTSALRCFSCNGTESCTNTEECPVDADKGYSCFKTTTIQEQAGVITAVTFSGCQRSERCKQAPNPLCIAKKNCITTCCTTNKCNGNQATRNGVYPKCYECLSDVSFERCQDRSSLKTCKQNSGKAYCFKGNIVMISYTGRSKLGYTKGCTDSLQACQGLRDSFCKEKSEQDCKVYCCEGDACNGGSPIETINFLYAVICTFCAMLLVGF